MARISPKYLSLAEDWAKATYALIQSSRHKLDIQPASIPQMISVFMDHIVGQDIGKALKSHGSLFEHHGKIFEKTQETADALRKHAPKRALIFEKMAESYLAAMNNGDDFVIPDEYLLMDFSKPVAEPKKRDPKMKLPQKLLNDWRDVTLAQMELHEIGSTPEITKALDENLLVIRSNFGHMTGDQFDDENNEEAIKAVLGQITGEPHITVAQYMRQAI